jgi:hypothetical protein
LRTVRLVVPIEESVLSEGDEKIGHVHFDYTGAVLMRARLTELALKLRLVMEMALWIVGLDIDFVPLIKCTCVLLCTGQRKVVVA